MVYDLLLIEIVAYIFSWPFKVLWGMRGAAVLSPSASTAADCKVTAVVAILSEVVAIALLCIRHLEIGAMHASAFAVLAAVYVAATLWNALAHWFFPWEENEGYD